MLALILSHLQMVLAIALVLSEAAAAVSQLAFPDNQGLNGVLAAIIKALQGLGAKEPPQQS